MCTVSPGQGARTERIAALAPNPQGWVGRDPAQHWKNSETYFRLAEAEQK